MKIPKGGLHNINQSSQANINDSWNVLATDETNAVLIAVDKCGNKKTVGDTTEIKNSIQALEQENIEQDNKLNLVEQENIEQDNRLNLVEQENQNQNTLISELIDDVTNLEGIHYTWSPTNRTLTLYDNNGNRLSQVSLVSLDNEGTDLRYNATTLSLELYNADNELIDSISVSDFVKNVGTQLQLNSNQLQLKDSQGNILATVSFAVSNINGLQTALDNKQDKLSSFDESILIDSNGNIEGNVSLFQEYFEQQICELNFTPIQIIGVYKDGIKLLPEEFNITLPKTITITTYSSEKIEIQYTHLKNS